ncbi:hypothetical protein OROMI_021159 [Orobanche minor]
MCFKESISLFLLCSCLTITLSSGANTLSANHALFGGNTSNYYIGIWYKALHVDPLSIVWVANRETPISDRFRSELKIIDGNLVLLNESKSHIWSTNVTTSTTTFKSVIAVMLDNGNLVLREGSNSVEPFWQSFDHLTHTWFPGAKLGYNNRTKKSHIIRSWRSNEDPAAGLFSVELVLSTREFVSKWNGSHQYWTSGPWDGKAFGLIPDLRHGHEFSYHTNENESYFTYSLVVPSYIAFFVLDVSGKVQQLATTQSTKELNLIWFEPKTQCEVYALCGSFGICREHLPFCNCLTRFQPRSQSDWNQSDFSGGCLTRTDLQCGKKKERQDFLMITVKNLPPNNSTVAVGSAGECHTTCLSDCSCNAYSFVDNQCSVWDGDLLNLSEVNGSGNTIHIKVAYENPHHPKKSKLVTISAVVGSVGGVVLVLGLILLLINRIKKMPVGKPTINFSHKLGGGGFGSIFKGVLHDSSLVAVKRLESISQGEKQFRSEVSTIGNIQHVNLVRLRGFCAEGNNKLLVYDYMAHGSLDTHLFHGNEVLNWEKRYHIALGTARGLVYLHDKCRECIIHCDIKLENILLDADCSPRISEFGLAKLVGRDFSRVLTTIRGSIGYIAPEWLSGLAVTPKADVYSYGMMLFELVFGKRNSQGSEDSRYKYFPGLVAKVVIEGSDILNVLDSRLNREACVEELTRICKVACWCIQDEEDQRPSMSTVERILEGLLDVSMPPIPQICHYNY